MKVHWTDTAEGHLDTIYAYIAKDSPEYALRVVDRLTGRSQQIADFPLSGRKVPEYEMEQLVGWAAPTKIDLKNGGQSPLYRLLKLHKKKNPCH